MTDEEEKPDQELLRDLYFTHWRSEMEVPRARMSYTQLFTAFNVTLLVALLAASAPWNFPALGNDGTERVVEIQENAQIVLLAIGTVANYIWLRISRAYGNVIRTRHEQLAFYENIVVPNADKYGIHVREARDLFGVEVDENRKVSRKHAFLHLFNWNYNGLSHIDAMLPLMFFLGYLAALVWVEGIYAMVGLAAFLVASIVVTLASR